MCKYTINTSKYCKYLDYYCSLTIYQGQYVSALFSIHFHLMYIA